MSLFYKCEHCGQSWCLYAGPVESVPYGIEFVKLLLICSDGHKCVATNGHSRKVEAIP